MKLSYAHAFSAAAPPPLAAAGAAHSTAASLSATEASEFGGPLLHGQPGRRSAFQSVVEGTPPAEDSAPAALQQREARAPSPGNALPGSEEEAVRNHRGPETQGFDERDKLGTMSGNGIWDKVAKRAGRTRREYHIFVDTGTMPGARTTGDVYLQLFGSQDRTGLIHLKHGFVTGSRAEFSVYGTDVGRVERMRLVADTPDGWFCDRVWLRSPEGVKEFAVGQWVGWPNNPEVTVQPLMAALRELSPALAVAIEGVLRCRPAAFGAGAGSGHIAGGAAERAAASRPFPPMASAAAGSAAERPEGRPLRSRGRARCRARHFL